MKLKMNACDEVNHGGERYGFARVRHVADPDAKQKSPGFSNTWTSSFSGAVPAMAYGEFWRIRADCGLSWIRNFIRSARPLSDRFADYLGLSLRR